MMLNCRDCRFWGTLDDEKRNRSMRLCSKDGLYCERNGTCVLAEHQDPVVEQVRKQMTN